MGIYDRDYLKDEGPYRDGPGSGATMRWPQTIVVNLIVINVALFFINGLFFSETNRLTDLLSAHGDTLTRPLLWWQFLTYGFAHSPTDVWHVLMNMLQLFFLGRMVEQVYGRWEFLRLYLVMIVFGSLVWAVTARLIEPQVVLDQLRLLGASGAVCGVVVLFILRFPNETLTLFPLPIPIKAWVLGVVLVAFNVLGAVGSMGNTAWGVHLAGMGFAYVYFRSGWNLGAMLPSADRLKRRPKLKIHDPDAADEQLSQEVDRILEKIHREGESSLTRKERRTMESASRKYQQRRED